MTPEQLGLGQNDPKVLRLPDGLETGGEEWIQCREMEKLIVSSSIKTLGKCIFSGCK